jgi:hypothetical protein
MDILMMNLNGLSAIALCVGLYFIKHHNRKAHASMLLAVAFPSLLLVSYIVHHTPHDERFFRAGPVAHAAPVAGSRMTSNPDVIEPDPGSVWPTLQKCTSFFVILPDNHCPF